MTGFLVFRVSHRFSHKKRENGDKKNALEPFVLGFRVVFLVFSSGGRTRTYDLRVMSPTSYRLLYSAMWSAKVGSFFEIPKFF